MKIFIADDSAVMRERIIEMLSELPGIKIAGEAPSSRKAIDSIKKLKPDVVILDIRMRGGNGIEVLKNNKKNRKPLVIVLTNYPYPQYRKKCMEAGADFFFDKATEFHKINEVLKELIQRSKTRGNLLAEKRKKTTRSDKK